MPPCLPSLRKFLARVTDGVGESVYKVDSVAVHILGRHTLSIVLIGTDDAFQSLCNRK